MSMEISAQDYSTSPHNVTNIWWDIRVKYSNELLIRHLESAQDFEFVGLRPTPKLSHRAVSSLYPGPLMRLVSVGEAVSFPFPLPIQA
jgi:hypothetical protein